MSSSSPFVVHNDAFRAILGEGPTLELLAENDSYPFAHEAGIFIASRNEPFITSNCMHDAVAGQRAQISRVHLDKASNSSLVTCEEISRPDSHGNGRVNYKDGIIIYAQGSRYAPSGLYEMSIAPPYSTTLLKSDFQGQPFNSVNDAVVHSDGTIWLPNQVYRFNPVDGSIRAMADGFGRPNGICTPPHEKVVYVTDTDWIHGDGTTDDTTPSSIYAFDVALYHGQPFLTNRSVANFCFGRNGELFLLNENRLWKASLKGKVKGALLGI
ncbi:hypothetical protein BJY00DRAFT_304835 [Aspergillus carlsbadensis]|nr:hypothetical protein BJY00DRAFT_304835 [Aspergillus carlsbadensis]